FTRVGCTLWANIMPAGADTSGARPQIVSWGAGTIVFLILECLVIAQAYLAYQDHFFTEIQMQARGVAQGLPFRWHFAMWTDFIFISPVAAYLTWRYFPGWRTGGCLPRS